MPVVTVGTAKELANLAPFVRAIFPNSLLKGFPPTLIRNSLIVINQMLAKLQ
jgi:hypothetical protein